MKNIVSLLLILLTLNLKSQLPDSSIHHKFDIGFTFSPDISYRKIKTDPVNGWMKENYDTLEVTKYGFTTGLNFIFPLNKKIEINSGILFCNKGEKTKKTEIPQVNNYVNHFYYLDIPIQLIYYPHYKKYYYSKPKKNYIFLSAGFSANIFLNSKSITTSVDSYNENVISNETNITRLNFSFLAGFGIITPITKKWYFKFEPIYRRDLTSISSYPIKKYFFSFGFNIGLFSKF